MRLLVLSKRQYTGKDLLGDRYGRLYELPVALAARGHAVAVLAASYRRRGELHVVESGVSWHSVDVYRAPMTYLRTLRTLLRDFCPDVIWSSSDAFHMVGSVAIGGRSGVPVVGDFYDDYEAFGLTSLPGMRALLRRASGRMDAMTVVSHSLAGILATRVPTAVPMEVVENGVPDLFRRSPERHEARRCLGLPPDAPLIGTAGALSSSRGIGDLLEAYRQLRERNPATRLVVAGPRDSALAGALAENTIDLGVLPHDQVPLLYVALDVGVVCNKDSAFGRACYPQKLAEMVASGLPVVVAAVGDARLLLESFPACLYTPGDADGLSRQLEQQLRSPVVVPPALAWDWSALAVKLEGLLERAVRS